MQSESYLVRKTKADVRRGLAGSLAEVAMARRRFPPRAGLRTNDWGIFHCAVRRNTMRVTVQAYSKPAAFLRSSGLGHHRDVSKVG